MATYREMHKLSQNPGAVTMLAGYLRKLDTVAWTDWELDFLDSMASRSSSEPISTRQGEVLAQLNDNAKSYTSLEGLSIASLVRDCWQARVDLSEDDEAFIVGLTENRVTSLKRRQALRLLACARQLELIDGYINIG
jgi:hypothetical protein